MLVGRASVGVAADRVRVRRTTDCMVALDNEDRDLVYVSR